MLQAAREHLSLTATAIIFSLARGRKRKWKKPKPAKNQIHKQKPQTYKQTD